MFLQFLLPAVVAHFNLSIKRRATHISTQPSNPSSQVPVNLPDSRTAQRLLDVLAQLEHSLRLGRQSTGAANTELETRLANLQFENQRLRTTRQQAASRLGSLIVTLQAQLETDKPTQETLAATLSTLTEHAA